MVVRSTSIQTGSFAAKVTHSPPVTVLDAKTLQAWLKYPYQNYTSLKASWKVIEGEKPDLCLITGFVYLNDKAELSDIQRVLEELHVACLNYPAYGGIICNRPYCLTFCPLSLVSSAHPLCKPGVETGASYPTNKRKKGTYTAGYIGTNFEEKMKDDNHAYVMTVCDDFNYYICSHGRCSLGTPDLHNPETPDPLGLGERVSQLKGLGFVLFCEKRKQFGIDLHVIGNVLSDFEMFMGEGYQLYLHKATRRLLCCLQRFHLFRLRYYERLRVQKKGRMCIYLATTLFVFLFKLFI
jgi:hypothetical protein